MTRPAGAIVTYFPDALFPERLAAVARETRPLVVVDNSADPAVHAALRAACALHHAKLIENANNAGLAAALNSAWRALEPTGVEWMVAFDQDSMPEAGFADALVQAAGESTKPCFVGANWHEDARSDFPSRHLRPHPRFPLFFTRTAAKEDLRQITCVITSGTLFHLPSVKALGGFAEELFLDLVDTDICLRFRRAGHDIRVASAAKLHHRRGAKRPVRLLGRTWWPAFMPETRLFYVFRNRIQLLRREGLHVPHWALFELTHSVKMLTEIIWLEDRKVSKLRACARGIWHGLFDQTSQ